MYVCMYVCMYIYIYILYNIHKYAHAHILYNCSLCETSQFRKPAFLPRQPTDTFHELTPRRQALWDAMGRPLCTSRRCKDTLRWSRHGDVKLRKLGVEVYHRQKKKQIY